jgi:virulence factor Mce-like protein
MSRARVAAATAITLVLLVACSSVLLVRQSFFAPHTIIAYFVSATGIYPGDEVRVSGVKVGTIAAIDPVGTQAKITLKVDRDIVVPADGKAIIVAQNLVAARYVQLASAYRSSGPGTADGTVIPLDRTGVPVEWDEVKAQLMRLSTDLGPGGNVSTPAAARFIDSAANALGGNGDQLRETLAQLSGVGRILADGSGNIVDTIKNLQTFVTALSGSNEQVVQFQDRLATLTSVLDQNKSTLDASLDDVSVALADVKRFVAENRDQAAEQIQRLGNVTQNLVDNREQVKQLLHVAPNAFGNFYNIYNPHTGTPSGEFVFNNISNPVQFICAAIASVENATATESGKLCAQYLGPALRLLSINWIPLPLNPYLMPSAPPEDLVYSDPSLAPGGGGPAPGPGQAPPAVSAYTGAGDIPPPPGYGQPPAVAPGPTAPDHGPAYPSPALYPGAPIPTVSSLPDMLLPAEGPTP